MLFRKKREERRKESTQQIKNLIHRIKTNTYHYINEPTMPEQDLGMISLLKNIDHNLKSFLDDSNIRTMHRMMDRDDGSNW